MKRDLGLRKGGAILPSLLGTADFQGVRASRTNHIAGKILGLILLGLLMPLASFAAAPTGGPCPSNAPVTGNHCFFIAANGSDTNNGISESTPWLHAPGMPNCSGQCATVQAALGSYGSSAAGIGLIFRGGDTWHFGNSSASPYTGGTWTPQWDGQGSTCQFEGNQTGCFYIGVDTSWFSGGSWSRPVLSGDNPTTSTTVSSCAYQTGSSDTLLNISASPYQILDSLEFTGLCATTAQGAYISNNGLDQPQNTPMMTYYVNLYMHGWSVTAATATGSSLICVIFAGGSLMTFDHVVVDGSDSNPGTCAWGTFPSIQHMRDSIFRHTTQGVANWCHDIHDNIFEYFYNPYIPTHGNALECNMDATGNAQGQPQNTPNVFYNNIMRHFDPGMGLNGQVDLWLCPTAIPEYWFNNLMYDLNPTPGQGSWDIAGPPTYGGCPNTGRQYMFNNTLVDTNQPCYLGPNGTKGQYLIIANEQMIGAGGYDGSGAGGCIGGPGNTPSSTIVNMSDALASTQGYTTGSPGTAFIDSCANDSTRPCSPTASGASTVGTGNNLQSYCTTLAGYTSEPAIATDAANACKYATTNACSYNAATHTMVCPAQAPVARPVSGAWDVGAYQYSSSQTQPAAPQVPTLLTATPCPDAGPVVCAATGH